MDMGGTMTLDTQLLETWNIHNRIIFYILDALTPESLAGVPAGKGRSVGQILAHIHNVRLMWLNAAAPDLIGEMEKIPTRKKDAVTLVLLRASLEASRQAMEALFKRGFEKGRISGFKPHPAAAFGYFLAHEWYHLGETGMTLSQAGFPLDEKTAYGIWEWGSR